MKHALFILLVSLGSAAQANALVNGPKGCGFLDGFDAYGPIYTVDEDHLVMTGESLEGIEWFCAFERPFDTDLEEGEIEVRAGYCMEPGPDVTPQVFTLLEMGDGTMQLASSDWEEPLSLTICRAP